MSRQKAISKMAEILIILIILLIIIVSVGVFLAVQNGWFNNPQTKLPQVKALNTQKPNQENVNQVKTTISDYMTNDEAKKLFNATEIVSNNLPNSIEFWTAADCHNSGSQWAYKIPDGYSADSCKNGETGSHGGCPTCIMSDISLVSNDQIMAECASITNSAIGWDSCDMMLFALNKNDITICENNYDPAWCFIAFPKLLPLTPAWQKYNDGCYRNPPAAPVSITITGAAGLIGHENGVEKLSYVYPNTYDDGTNDYTAEIAPAATFLHILSIPFNTDRSVLRAYVSRKDSDIAFIRLAKYSFSTGQSKLLGDIGTESGGNYGGIYFPIAISKDDSHIILNSAMGSPGAGGGCADLGYAYIPITKIKYDECGYLKPESIRRSGFHGGQVYFYDNFSKALFFTEENNIPPSLKPDSDYQSAINFINIITGETKILLEEPDTTYEITNVDEKSGTFNFTSTKYTFSAAYPRDEGGSGLHCDNGIMTCTTQNRAMNLP